MFFSTAFQVYHNSFALSRTFLLSFLKKERRRRDLNPRAAINDLLPFQGSPFGQLGYFSKLPYLLSSSDIYLCRSQRQVILYLVFFMLSSTFLTFFKKFFILYLTNGESGIRTHAPLRTNGFQDRLVMTTSIPLHNVFCCCRFVCLTRRLVYNTKPEYICQHFF